METTMVKKTGANAGVYIGKTQNLHTRPNTFYGNYLLFFDLICKNGVTYSFYLKDDHDFDDGDELTVEVKHDKAPVLNSGDKLFKEAVLMVGA